MNIITAQKKPLKIEAMHYDGTKERMQEITDWIRGSSQTFCRIKGNSFFIKTLEGEMEVYPNDYVICGIKGEYYPCKPDIFEGAYDIPPKKWFKYKN